MKRYLLSLLLAATMATPLLAADSIDSVFDDFSKVDNADYVNVRPFMMKLCGLVGACQGDLDARIIRKVRSVKVLDLDSASQTDKTRLAERMASMTGKNFEELISVTDEKERVKIFGVMKKNYISKLIIYTRDHAGTDCTLISLAGKFTKEDLSNLVKNSSDDK